MSLRRIAGGEAENLRGLCLERRSGVYHGNVTGLIRLWDSLPEKPLRSWDPPVCIGGVLWMIYDAATQLCDSL